MSPRPAAYQGKAVERFEELDAARLERTFRVNVEAMFHLVRYALPHFEKGGAIINSASVQAYHPNASILDYGYRHFGSEEAWVLGCWSSSRELCAICSQPAPLSRLRQRLPWSIALKAEPEQQRALIATDARF